MDKLKTCLSSIQESYYPNFEVIVSDCVTLGIKDWIKKNFPDVKLISFERDIGPAASRNSGLSISNPDSKYVVFVDNDVEVNPEWLKNLIAVMENNLGVGAAQPLLLKMSNHEEIDSMGGFFDYIGYACLPPFFSSRVCGVKSPIDICYCEAVTAMRRNVLTKLQDASQPYDSRYFQHWEDVDLCWAVMLLGYKVKFIPSAIVFHERGVSSGLGKQTASLVFLNTRNRLMTLIKNYEMKNLMRYIPVLFIFELLKTVVLLRNNSTHALATFKGLFWILKNLPIIWLSRAKIQVNVRKVDDSKIKKTLVKPSITRLFSDFHRHYG